MELRAIATPDGVGRGWVRGKPSGVEVPIPSATMDRA